MSLSLSAARARASSDLTVPTGQPITAATSPSVRPSRSRPEQGLIKVRTTTLNQNDEAVQVIIANLVVPRRPTQGGAEANMSEHVDPAGERVSRKYRRTTAAAPTGDH